jgi:PAS domain S-box-containing protein
MSSLSAQPEAGEHRVTHAHLASAHGELGPNGLSNGRSLESMHDSEERFRAVAQSATDAIVTMDRRGDIVFWNRAAETIFGYTSEEVLGQPLALIMPERLRAAHQNAVERLVASGEPRLLGKTVKMVGLRKDGSEFPVELSLSTWKIRDDVFFTGILRDITEQVRTEMLLRERNQFIINALEALNHPFCVIDANDYSIKIANSAAGGDDLPESMACYALTHRRDTPCGTGECTCPLEAVKATKKPVIVEHVHYDRDGERRIYEVHGHPVFGSGGNVAQIIEYTLDITERKWWEEALQKERDFTSAVLDTAGALVVVLDPEGRIVRFNRACERLTGYPFDEVRGQHFWDIFLVPEELEPVKAVFAELSAGQFPNTHENVWVARDGSQRSISWSNTALVDGTGSVEYVIGTGIDVTERRRAEEALRQAHDELELRVQERTRELREANRILKTESARHRRTADTLRESEERYRHLVELSFQGILIHRDGKLVSINPAGATLLGAARPEELVGMPLRDLFHPACWDSAQARVQCGLDDETGMVPGEEKLLRLDGTSVDVEVAAVPVSYQGQPAVQVVLRDLTAHKQAELERRRIARDLHDSLGHSIGYLHLKLDQLAGSEGLDDTARLRQEAARMRDVASQAYDMVRGMLATLHPSNATDLATGLLVMAQAAGQRADFEVRLSSEGSASALHPVVQQQALFLFREALNNVVKHASARHVYIHLSWGESDLAITLSDDGSGFQVGERVPEGHYGLSMMRARAQEIGGQLTFRSRPGAGTQVALRVPLLARTQRATEW